MISVRRRRLALVVEVLKILIVFLFYATRKAAQGSITMSSAAACETIDYSYTYNIIHLVRSSSKLNVYFPKFL